ncbi:ABC-2 type transport system ATP-binding protein [Melghiribacillus thermohalophilus]|uniref:ABC-2 type transport system ATP-binding protein n=1 Tax=Melghiribacillus thermohalophilus TaxID=1324956 RepID=A0A4R3MTI5_9BACI|nr:ABC transporter ATP-binding protein [Melghiribacillus thermohalophilus]TCT19624.1 ABC-2 type transport system ATP-binding protein [Melghiribacillus thermohalophilus]
MLEAVDLTKHYKQTRAVDGVNLFIEKGEIIGLLGPNGAGKSTTISMLSTLIQPSSGDVRYLNESMLKHPQKLREHLGVVPQEIALYSDLTARENLEFFGKLYKMNKRELTKRMEEVFQIVGLENKQRELVKHFSGGMKRRLNIGAALLHQPSIMFMDEPTVGIDPQSRSYILDTVKQLNREHGMTIVYTSHYMEEVEYLCDRIYIMDQGKIIASGTKAEIKNILSSEQTFIIEAQSFKKEFVERLMEDVSVRQVSESGNKVTVIVPKDLNYFQTIIQMADETNQDLKAVEVQKPTLEDVFLHLTGKALRD